MIGPAWVQATGAYVVESCSARNGSPGEEYRDAPSVREVDAGGGVRVRQACGLIANELYTPAFEAKFVRDVCGRADGQFDEACSKRFTEMFVARLSERYASAAWSAVTQHCTAYPFDCNSPIAIERQLLASHNAGIQAWYAGAVAYAQARQTAYAERLQEEEARESQQRHEDRRRFWGVVAAGLAGAGQALSQPNEIHCTSTQSGSTAYTNCH